MTTFYLALVFLLFPVTVWSAPHQYKIDSKIFFNGKSIASPRLVTEDGKMARVMTSNQKTQRDYAVEMTPVYLSNNQVQLTYNVFVKKDKNETISRGSIILDEDQRGQVAIDNGRIQLHLNIAKYSAKSN